MSADGRSGSVNPLSFRTLPKSGPRYTLHLPADLFDHTVHCAHINEVTHYLHGSGAPGRTARLDGSSAQRSPGMDGTHARAATAI